MGFTGGEILDPAMGTGNFFGNLPAEMAKNSRLYGVELDSLTARIAKELYPEAKIQNRGFERTKFENGTFDVIVGSGISSPTTRNMTNILSTIISSRNPSTS